MRSYITKVELLFVIEIRLKTRYKSKIQIFLLYLLSLLTFMRLSFFCLVFETSTPGLTIYLVIGKVDFINRVITIYFF